jgi:hypothetical protein
MKSAATPTMPTGTPTRCGKRKARRPIGKYAIIANQNTFHGCATRVRKGFALERVMNARQTGVSTEIIRRMRAGITFVFSVACLIWNDLSSQLVFRTNRNAASVAVEAAIATVDHSDIRGSSRIIVIRRELPRTNSAGSARRPTA